MAMTKAEKARVEQLERDLGHALALRWSGHREPTMIPPPQYGEPETSGWRCNYYRGLSAREAVTRGWSSAGSHGSGPERTARSSASQRGVSLFATRRDALIALRIAREREFAGELAAIDAEIESDGGPDA